MIERDKDLHGPYGHCRSATGRTAIFIRSLTFRVICLCAMMAHPAKVIGAESNLEHKLAPMNTASSNPEFGLRSGSLIVALNRPGFPRGLFVQNSGGFFKSIHLCMEFVLQFLRRPMAIGAV